MENIKDRKANIKWTMSKEGKWIIEQAKEIKTEAATEENTVCEFLRDLSEIENFEKFRVGTVVSCCWGEGKITNIKANGMAEVRIEGNEIELPLSELNPYLRLYFYILKAEGSVWADMQFDWSDTSLQIKLKVADVVACHPSQVVLIHNGKKIADDFVLMNSNTYEKDRFLVVINDPVEFTLKR